MMAVGSIGDSSAQRLQALLMMQALTAAGTTAAQSTESTTNVLSGAGAATGNPNGMAALQEQIEQAIATALGSLDKTSSAQEVMQTIKDAIDQTLRANGIDVESMQGSAPSPPPGDGTPAVGGPQSNDADGKSLEALIDRLLDENGFDAQEIKRELQQAMASSVTGTESTSATMTLIMQFPLSGGVDTQA
jgi:hypothetical protein